MSTNTNYEPDFDFEVGDDVQMTQEWWDITANPGDGRYSGVLVVAEIKLPLITVYRKDNAYTKTMNVNVANLELVSGRVEGRRIKRKDIRIGDVIKSYEIVGDRIFEVTAEVCGIDGGYPTSKGGKLIGYMPNENAKYTLLEAAPEVDELLEKMKSAKKGAVIQFNNDIFLKISKGGLSPWRIYHTGGNYSVGVDEARGILGSETFKWLAFEKEEPRG